MSFDVNQSESFDDSFKSDPGREVAIFTEALKLPAQERGAFLETMCGGNEYLRRKIEELLRAHNRLGSFLEEGPTGGVSNGEN
jgi:hypothetical protein